MYRFGPGIKRTVFPLTPKDRERLERARERLQHLRGGPPPRVSLAETALLLFRKGLDVDERNAP